MILRDYQADCCFSITNAMDAGESRILAVLATGLGKTVIFCRLADYWHEQGRGRVLVICPTIELVHQGAEKLERITGVVPAIEQANNWSNETDFGRSDFIVASKPSLVSKWTEGKKRYQRLSDVGLIVIDEAHLAATKQYVEILDHFGCPVLGVTATPKRHDKVALSELFDHVAFRYGIKEAIDDGWLVGCRSHCVQLQSLDLSEVSTRGGDFVQSDLGEVMAEDETVYEVAEVTAREARSDKTIVFTASVDQAMKVSGVLADRYQLKSEWVCGDASRCPKDKREAVLESFTEDPDGIQIVCNVGVLTTGFDFPGLQHIVMARPTKSQPLFTQIFGRGTRALDGVVDFEGSTAESRKEMIAWSPKPFFRFTDLRDTSLQHKLVTPVDVLAGEKTIDEQEAARKILEQSDEDRDLREVLEEAAEAVREQEAAERARLARRRASAQYTRVEVDPFGKGRQVVAKDVHGRSGARMPFGKYRGKLVEDVPVGYLKYMKREYGFRQGWLRIAVDKRIGSEA